MPDVTDGLEVVVACSSHSSDVAVERQTAIQYHTEDSSEGTNFSATEQWVQKRKAEKHSETSNSRHGLLTSLTIRFRLAVADSLGH